MTGSIFAEMRQKGFCENDMKLHDLLNFWRKIPIVYFKRGKKNIQLRVKSVCAF